MPISISFLMCEWTLPNLDQRHISYIQQSPANESHFGIYKLMLGSHSGWVLILLGSICLVIHK